MRDNVKNLLGLLADSFAFPQPALEVGALQTEGQETFADMRPLLNVDRYYGLDMQSGTGVDVLGDAHRLGFADRSFGTLLLLDTLEHVQSPAVVVREAARLLRDGGVVVLASVMNFPVHSFPSDYWRFTPAAFDYLLWDFPSRFVYSQGDAEFPHTVVGMGMLAQPRSPEAGAFRSALDGAQARWPEKLQGGPFNHWRHANVVFSQRSADRVLPALERDRRLVQTFVCPRDELCRIDVKMTTFGRYDQCHVLFRLVELADPPMEIAAHRLFAPHLIDGGWVQLSVPVQKHSAGRRYVLEIESPDGAHSAAPAVYASNGSACEGFVLTVAGEQAEGSLCFQAYCSQHDPGISEAARGESARDVPSPGFNGGSTDRPVVDAGWEQARYISSILGASIDSLRADLESVQERLQAMERIQRETLEQSTEAAAITRAVRRTPLSRFWKRSER